MEKLLRCLAVVLLLSLLVGCAAKRPYDIVLSFSSEETTQYGTISLPMDEYWNECVDRYVHLMNGLAMTSGRKQLLRIETQLSRSISTVMGT